LPIAEIMMLLDQAIIKGLKRCIADQLEFNRREVGEFFF
jgi:hypothetical protein